MQSVMAEINEWHNLVTLGDMSEYNFELLVHSEYDASITMVKNQIQNIWWIHCFCKEWNLTLKDSGPHFLNCRK